MLILERTDRWYEWGAGYLDFSSAVGWFMCAVLVAKFRPSRDATSLERRDASSWLALAAGFALLTLAALASVLDRNGRGWAGFPELHTLETLAGTAGAVLLLAFTPRADGARWVGWRHGLVASGGLLSLIYGYARPGAAPWILALVCLAGVLGLTAQRWSTGSGAHDARAGRAIAFILADALATLGLAAATTAAFPPSALPSLLHAIGACGTGGAWWWLYLQERTLSTVRERRSLFRLRPLWLLPTIQLLVLAVGCLAQRSAVQQAERFAARRAAEEFQSLVSAFGDRLSPGRPPDAMLSPDEEQRVAVALQALLDALPAYHGCALTVTDSAGKIRPS